jgi:hypothetical protein
MSLLEAMSLESLKNLIRARKFEENDWSKEKWTIYLTYIRDRAIKIFYDYDIQQQRLEMFEKRDQ